MSRREDLRHQFIEDLGPKSRAAVREAALRCMDLWPNSHLGAHTRREDLASVFRIIRANVAAGQSVWTAATRLSDDAHRYEDM